MSLWAKTPRALKIATIAIVATAAIVALRYAGIGAMTRAALAWISSLGAIAPVIFIALYIVACVLFVPASIITIGAGAIFGVLWGSVYVSIGATAGATCAFLIGRYLARERVARWIARRRNFAAIDAAVAREGWKIVALTRLSPVFPFNALNYAYGLTRVRLRDYVIATWAGALPGTVMYVYIGSLARNLAAVGAGSKPPPAGRWILDGLGFAATAAVAFYAAKIARNALRHQALEENDGASAAAVPDHSG
jgi:uncharacterized membrane protein YdjX (TVP38/TMEM64 family)